jgi:RecJ-like exonuclease
MHKTQMTDEFNIRCPVCRDELGSDTGEIYDRYKICSGLDKLENFTMVGEYMTPEICYDCDMRFGKKHYLGTNRHCHQCQLYRETGKK